MRVTACYGPVGSHGKREPQGSLLGEIHLDWTVLAVILASQRGDVKGLTASQERKLQELILSV